MKGNRGQALVEFVLIIPILLLIIITMVDFSNILLKKYSLENDLDTISEMYKENDTETLYSYLNDNDIKVTYDRDNNYIKINVSKDVDIISPVLISIFGSKYEIKTSGVYYE